VVNNPKVSVSENRYGAVAFVATMVNILIVEFVTWIYFPWMPLVLIVLPILLLDLAVAAVLATRPGMLGAVGRGMLVGWLAVPISLVIFIPAYITIAALGLI